MFWVTSFSSFILCMLNSCLWRGEGEGWVCVHASGVWVQCMCILVGVGVCIYFALCVCVCEGGGVCVHVCVRACLQVGWGVCVHMFWFELTHGPPCAHVSEMCVVMFGLYDNRLCAADKCYLPSVCSGLQCSLTHSLLLLGCVLLLLGCVLL